MVRLETRADVERYVQKLKNLYGEFSLFALLLFATLVFCVFGGLALWPLWIVLTWGIILFLKASKLHVISRTYYDMAHGFRESLPFIKADWQEAKINDLVKRLRLERADSPKKAAAPKKAPAKKAGKVVKKAVKVKTAASKKTATKKTTVKKTPSKKKGKK